MIPYPLQPRGTDLGTLVVLLYLWDSLVTLELISLLPLAGSPETDPLAVKLLDNRLYIYPCKYIYRAGIEPESVED